MEAFQLQQLDDNLLRSYMYLADFSKNAICRSKEGTLAWYSEILKQRALRVSYRIVSYRVLKT